MNSGGEGYHGQRALESSVDAERKGGRMPLQEFIEKQGLTEEELQRIKLLAEVCNEDEGIRLKLNWDMLQERPAGETNDFLVYENGELVGFLGIYSFRSTEAEISGMVHPQHRRKGIFTKLVQAAIRECRRRGIPKLIFICQQGSASGKAFLRALETTYAFSEYWMEMICSESDSDGTDFLERSDAPIRLRSSTAEDIEVLTELDVRGFDMTEEDAREYEEKTITAKNESTLVAELDGRAIGKLGVMLNEELAFIYGFCVLPERRGRGFGRQILAMTIDKVRHEKKLNRFQLEVAADNERALDLYESCGFRVKNVNDYYEMALN
jgi:ribosomal protein S18 acetylase RimI-like enzyme